MKVNLPMQVSNAAEVPPRQICVVSILRNDSNAVWQSLAPRLLANKERFCTVCGVRCLITSDQLSDRPASWDRIPLLQRAFRMGCEVALWVDADAIFLRPLWIEGMARLAPLSFDSSTASNGLNAGVILAAADAHGRCFSSRDMAGSRIHTRTILGTSGDTVHAPHSSRVEAAGAAVFKSFPPRAAAAVVAVPMAAGGAHADVPPSRLLLVASKCCAVQTVGVYAPQ